MPTVPVRGIAKGGVVTDVDPYNLPLGSWSWGSNVRFKNGSITRGPIFRSVKQSLLNSGPRYLTANIPSSGQDSIIIGYLNGKVSSLVSGTETDISVSGYTPSNSEAVYTSCHLGDVLYVNRSDRAPWSQRPIDTQLHTLANWAPVDGPWTAQILRASNSALCAFGITQNGVNHPTMVLTSEFATVDTVPSTWDYTLGTNNATQNILGEMQGPITDACALGNVMMIYGQNETWVMVPSGDDNIWDYQPLFSDQGAINANCAVEVDKKHYVFGLNDIWMHDGNSKVSICDEKTREFIYAGLNVTNASRCGVAYNVNLKELYFRYMSSDAFCAFMGADGCNRQATFHIPTSTWSFDDLPFIFGAVMADLDNVRTWASDTLTWTTSSGSWASLNDSAKKVLTMIGDVNATYSLTESVYAFDLEGPGSRTTYGVDTNATMGLTLMRDGIDLNEVGADLKGYKVISSIYPQGRLEAGAQPITFQFGSADYFNEAVTLSPAQTYDGSTLYKLDYNAAGRYLSMVITFPDWHYMVLTGFDFDLDILGEF